MAASESERQTGLRTFLVFLEVVVATLSLALNLLLLRSLWNIQRIDLGFSPSGLLAVQLEVPEPDLEGPSLEAYWRALLEDIRALPRVQAASLASDLPFSASKNRTTFAVEPPAALKEATANDQGVGPGFFRTLGVPLRGGRECTAGDGARNPRIVLLDETLARRLWPGLNPIGHRIGGSGPAGTWTAEVAGIVPVLRQRVMEAPQPMLYWCLAQDPRRAVALVLRTQGPPDALQPTVSRELRKLAPDLLVYGAIPVEKKWEEWSSVPRFIAFLLASFAAASLVLAILGVYGMASYTVHYRLREIAIRLALGASRGQILGLLLASSSWPVFLGVLVGLGACWPATRLVAHLLYGLTPHDPVSLALSAVILTMAGLTAAFVPAVAATAAPPSEALRAG